MSPPASPPAAPALVRVALHRLAHARSGDKGDRLNIALIAWVPAHLKLLAEQVSEARVRDWFAHRAPSRVRRHLLPRLGAMNFVLDDVLEGGVNQGLGLDGHGKSLSFHLLALPVLVPDTALSEAEAAIAAENAPWL